MSLFGSKKTVTLPEVYGWTWDQKPRGDAEVARRVKGVWSLTAKDMVMFGDKSDQNVLLDDVVVYETKSQWRVRLGDVTFKLPDGCVTKISSGGLVFDVVQVVGFVGVPVGYGIRYVVGCVGYNPETEQAALFSVLPDDPMVALFNHVVMHVKDADYSDTTSSNPMYSPNEGFVYDTTMRLQRMDAKEQQVKEDLAHLTHIANGFSTGPGEPAIETEEVKAVYEELEELRKRVKEYEAVRERGSSFTPLQEEKVYSAVKRQVEEKEIAGVKVLSLKDFSEEEKNQLDRESALREANERTGKDEVHLKVDIINGKKVLNLSHMLVEYNKKQKEQEAKPPSPVGLGLIKKVKTEKGNE